jgi:hypothetical protein
MHVRMSNPSGITKKPDAKISGFFILKPDEIVSWEREGFGRMCV